MIQLPRGGHRLVKTMSDYTMGMLNATLEKFKFGDLFFQQVE